MSQEAKFLVIIPEAHFTAAQLSEFTRTMQMHEIPVVLPLRTNALGSLIVTANLSLRDAQAIRRKVASCGYSADVISDTDSSAQPPQSSPSMSDPSGTLVVDLFNINEFPIPDQAAMHRTGPGKLSSISANTAGKSNNHADSSDDMWKTTDIVPIDLDLSETSDDTGEDDEDSEDATLSGRTQSIDIQKILSAAGNAGALGSFVDFQKHINATLTQSQQNRAVEADSSALESSALKAEEVPRQEEDTVSSRSSTAKAAAAHQDSADDRLSDAEKTPAPPRRQNAYAENEETDGADSVQSRIAADNDETPMPIPKPKAKPSFPQTPPASVTNSHEDLKKVIDQLEYHEEFPISAVLMCIPEADETPEETAKDPVPYSQVNAKVERDDIETPKKSHAWIIIILIVICLAAAAAGYFYLYKP